MMTNTLDTYVLKNEFVKLCLTQEGGHMAPVYFNLGNGRWAQPYSIAPWNSQGRKEADLPVVLKNLRGDFFCFPFGENPSETSHIHGETANGKWELLEKTDNSLAVMLEMQDVKGKVIKRINTKETFLYVEHEIDGVTGDFTYGHHAILQLPPDQSSYVKTSSFDFGSVLPIPFDSPENGEYSNLKVSHQFNALSNVQTKFGQVVSFESHPFQAGYDDLLMVSKSTNQVAWTALQTPDYVWISIKTTTQFPSTLFWNSNGGRHPFPWDGKHSNRLGIEEICGYFNLSIEEAKRNKLPNDISTFKHFDGEKTSLKNIQGIVPTNTSWGKFLGISISTNGLTINFENEVVEVGVDVGFLG